MCDLTVVGLTHEPLGDLGVGQSRGDQHEHLGLARREVVGQRVRHRLWLRRPAGNAATTWCCTAGIERGLAGGHRIRIAVANVLAARVLCR